MRRIFNPVLALPAMLTFVSACGSSDGPAAADPVLTVPSNPVSHTKGSQFIKVTATGAWTLSVSGDWGADGPTVRPASGNGSATNVVLSWGANTTEAARSATLILSEGSRTAVPVTFTQNAKETSGGSGGGEGGGEGGGDTPSTSYPAGNVKGMPGWMEMPEIPASHDKFGVFTHDMTIGSVHTRNYTFYWDYESLVAWWVAYPLNAWAYGSGSRTDEWGLDPLLAEKYQPVLYSGFKGYDRGHQLPSADRLNRAQNVTTFYFTNMTPQLAALNQNIWANFETQVRAWSNRSDTLYVVTGCVPTGSKTKTQDNVGKNVTVPVGYFKAVLRYQASSTIGFNGWSACAVYLEHKGYTQKTVSADMSMSVSALEDKLGYKLFVNLPSKVGEETAAKIKSQDPSKVSWWWN